MPAYLTAWLNRDDLALISDIKSLPWVADGVDELEVQAIERLWTLWRYITSEEVVVRIVAMPFLDSLEPSDVSALTSLAWSDKEHVSHVVDHPSLQGGITDQWAKILTILWAVADANPGALPQYLDPDKVTIQERTIELPLAGETLLAVISIGLETEQAMNTLEQVVFGMEELVGAPFPVRYVALHFRDSYGAGFSGTHITTPSYGVPNHSAAVIDGLIAHETAHYYWNSRHPWFNEGLAEATTAIVLHEATGAPLRPRNAPCSYLSNIAELINHPSALDFSSGVGDCNYSLGERLFIDFYQELGKDSFSAALLALHTLIIPDPYQETPDIELVENAFYSVPGINTSLVANILDRWYYGVE